jgi:hypothetical protein
MLMDTASSVTVDTLAVVSRAPITGSSKLRAVGLVFNIAPEGENVANGSVAVLSRMSDFQRFRLARAWSPVLCVTSQRC